VTAAAGIAMPPSDKRPPSPASPDTELIRFRVDSLLAQQAERVCAEAGFELRDVLRIVVMRMAREGTLPFDPRSASVIDARSLPFYEYDPRLWSELKPSIDAEVALALLSRFIADCSTRLDEAHDAGEADDARTQQLMKAREEARTLKASLDVSDAEAVRRVLDHFGPLVRSGAE
jgi:hypothetical protein